MGYVYQKDTVDIFKVNEISLSALFTEKSIELGETYLQMPKTEFVNILREIGYLVAPKKKSPEEEKKENG